MGIEQIDIRGTGSNTLKVSRLEVLNLSGHSNTLIVRGNSDAAVKNAMVRTATELSERPA